MFSNKTMSVFERIVKHFGITVYLIVTINLAAMRSKPSKRPSAESIF